MKAYRAALLRFNPSIGNGNGDDGVALYESDGLLLTSPDSAGIETVRAAGSWQSLKDQVNGVPVEHFPGRLIAPGFVDLHLHYPQTDIIGSPASGLLPWLENYTFPEEARFAEPDHSAASARFFVEELKRNGVTTALVFASAHVESVEALFRAAQSERMRLVTGLCLMDRHVPDGVRNQIEQSLVDTEALINQWHGCDRLGYAITPRFAPSCSDAQLRGAGELAARYADVWIQSHVAENHDEIAWARELFPRSRSYLSVYDDFGLMRERAVYAHCIHLDAQDRALMRQTGAAASVCPTSNLFLGSGFFDFVAAQDSGFSHGLASDVGGGTSFSPFHTMMAAYYVGRTALSGSGAKSALSLSPQKLWWLHTAGAAKAMGLGDKLGSLQVGTEADFVVLNPQATPLLARRTQRANSLDELLFSMIVLGDDRLVERTVLAGSQA